MFKNISSNKYNSATENLNRNYIIIMLYTDEYQNANRGPSVFTPWRRFHERPSYGIRYTTYLYKQP